MKNQLNRLQNPIISQILGIQNQYFHQPSVKNQKQKLFSSCLLWPWIDIILGNLHLQEFGQRIKQHARCKTRILRESQRRAQLWHHPERECKGYFYKIEYLRKYKRYQEN